MNKCGIQVMDRNEQELHNLEIINFTLQEQRFCGKTRKHLRKRDIF